MSRDDPYHDIKTIHKASMFRPDGAASPLCAKKPRAINLRRETWTLIWDQVTCKKCLAMKPEVTDDG